MPSPSTLTASRPSTGESAGARRIMLIGPGFRFLSGLSVYTCRMANALADSHDVSAILLDRLIPRRLYPGAGRVGHDLTSMRYDDRVRVLGHLDWYWGASIVTLRRTLRRERPDVIVLQWWTAAALHTYLLVARLAAREGIPVVIEFHEVQDTGEASVPVVAAYCRRYLRRLVAAAAGAICHTEHDAGLLASALGIEALAELPVRLAPHGPYDHLALPTAESPAGPVSDADRRKRPTRVLFFGLIRPYKGAEDLVYALDGMTAAEAEKFEIDIVGETWEDWTRVADAVAGSRYRDRINFDNRYVPDTEAAQYFGRADVVVLPYRRGSASGPLQIAMHQGKFVVMYAVGGLVEAVRDYPGAILLPPNDIDALRAALLAVDPRHDERFEDPHSWAPVIHAIESLATAGQRG